MRRCIRTMTLLVAAALTFALAARAQTFSTLHSFNGMNGANPYAGVIRDKAGNLYGTTNGGGAYGVGTVFKLDAAGKETVLHSFTGGADGAYPYASLILDEVGNLYGTTGLGGDLSCFGHGGQGCGVVFKLDASTISKETVLYSFTGADGISPYASLIRDDAGILYGTTCCGGSYGAGVVFKLDGTGKETVLHGFTGDADGGTPFAGLIRDKAGNLYGTTFAGGAYGVGTVFKLNATGTETVLYSFNNVGDGAGPYAGLIRDAAGNLYGTTCCGGAYGGIVFKLDRTSKETVLYTFTGLGGDYPYAGLIRDDAGNLYGTTTGGGTGWGTVFKLDTAGTETVLHSFTSFADGWYPYAGLIRDDAGNLYGTANGGGRYTYGGTVFKLTP
jgi:uncharacterized repeat protein (TIGR03803 family)